MFFPKCEIPYRMNLGSSILHSVDPLPHKNIFFLNEGIVVGQKRVP